MAGSGGISYRSQPKAEGISATGGQL